MGGRRLIDITGLRFGRLVVLKIVRRSTSVRWLCRCDCGVEKLILGSSGLRSGGTKSCGCLNREVATKRQTIHGMYFHKFSGIWKGMMSRCYRKKDKNYKNYGERGIKVCKKWHNPVTFISWYESQSPATGLTLERKKCER